jgi:hypothetical protein
MNDSSPGLVAGYSVSHSRDPVAVDQDVEHLSEIRPLRRDHGRADDPLLGRIRGGD